MSKENEASRYAHNLLDELISMSDDEFVIFLNNNRRVIRMITTRLRECEDK